MGAIHFDRAIFLSCFEEYFGATPMTRVTMASQTTVPSSPSTKFPFGWVARERDRDPRQRRTRATCERLHIEPHYFGACQGKNVSDSERATETYARDQVANQSWVVASSRDLCDKLAKVLHFVLSEPTDEEREGFEASAQGIRQRVRGKIITTEVSGVFGVCTSCAEEGSNYSTSGHI